MLDRLVWIDCEMTGLDLLGDALIEVACLVTDGDLTILGEGIDIVIHADDEALGKMLPFVQEMHRASGLTEEVRAATTTMADAEARVLAYIKEHVPEPGKAPLCGNSVGTDRGFIARDMPELEAYLHYRIVDVSSVKELTRRWFPKVYFAQPKKDGGHRALADIRESVRELAYYRHSVFVPMPGPETAVAQVVAADIEAQYAER